MFHKAPTTTFTIAAVFSLVAITKPCSAMTAAGFYPSFSACNATKRDELLRSCEPNNAGTRHSMLPITEVIAPRQPLPAFMKTGLSVAQESLITLVVYSHAFNDAWAAVPNEVDINTQVTLRVPATGSLPAGSKAMRITTSTFNGTLGMALIGNTHALIDPTRLKSLSLAIYFPRGQTVANSVGVKFSGPFKREFPSVKLSFNNLHSLDNYPGWYQADLPIEELNPNNTSFNSINIVNLTPTGRKRIFYLDNIEFHRR